MYNFALIFAVAVDITNAVNKTDGIGPKVERVGAHYSCLNALIHLRHQTALSKPHFCIRARIMHTHSFYLG